MAELEVSLSLVISVSLLLCTCPTTNAPHCGVQPFITDHYSKPRPLRISFSRLGGLVETDRVPPCNLCLRLKCFVWDAGGGAAGRRDSEYSHTYSWRGGLRASCYVWVIKGSKRPPPKPTLVPSRIGISLWGYFALFDIHWGSWNIPS